MKFIWTFFVVLCSFSALTQLHLAQIAGYEFYERYEYYTRQNSLEKEMLKEKKIRSRISTHRFKSGEQTKIIETFDKNGNQISYQQFNSKNEPLHDYHYTYNEKNQLISYTYRYGKKSGSARLTYDKDGHLYETRGYTINGEYFGRVDIYDGSHGKILGTELYKKDSVNAYKRLDYAYYEDNSLKSIRYFEKSRLKYTWTYDCKPEGEIVDIKADDTTRICIKEELDAAGNRIVWQQEFNEKGEPEKVKNIYAEDSTLISSTRFNKDNQLTSQTTYFMNGGLLHQVFDKKGQAISTHERVYNSQKQPLRESNISKRWYSNRWYSYSDELLTTSAYLGKRLFYVVEYQYEFYN